MTDYTEGEGEENVYEIAEVVHSAYEAGLYRGFRWGSVLAVLFMLLAMGADNLWNNYQARNWPHLSEAVE